MYECILLYVYMYMLACGHLYIGVYSYICIYIYSWVALQLLLPKDFSHFLFLLIPFLLLLIITDMLYSSSMLASFEVQITILA